MKLMKFGLAALAFAVTGLAHATVLTITMSGHIKIGHDSLGLFGTPRGSLLGLPYALTVSVEWNSPNHYSWNPGHSTVSDTSEMFVVEATVAGATYTFGVTDSVKMAANIFATTGVTLSGAGRDEFGRLVNIQESLRTAVHKDSLTDYLYYPVTSNSLTSFTVDTGLASTQFLGFEPSVFIMNGPPATLPQPTPAPQPAPAPKPAPTSSPVPEPTTALLFGAGLLGLVPLHRRRSRSGTADRFEARGLK